MLASSAALRGCPLAGWNRNSGGRWDETTAILPSFVRKLGITPEMELTDSDGVGHATVVPISRMSPPTMARVARFDPRSAGFEERGDGFIIVFPLIFRGPAAPRCDALRWLGKGCADAFFWRAFVTF